MGKVTIYRWLRDGFITGEQLTRGAPWRICIDQAGQERIVAVVPDGWIGLAEPVNVLGVPNAIGGISTTIGPRTTQDLRIKVSSEHAGLF